MLGTTTAHADEAPLCHDMSARRAVLDEGKQYLDQHAADRAIRFSEYDANMYLQYKNRYNQIVGIPRIDISDAELEAMPLDTSEQLGSAQSTAQGLEDALRLKSANKLYMRILKQREQQESGSELAQALESVARTMILSEAKVWITKEIHEFDQAPLAYGGYNHYADGGRWMGKRFLVHYAIKALAFKALDESLDRLSPSDLLAAEQLYSRALAIRRQRQKGEQSGWNEPDLDSDLLFLAAFKDRQNKVEEAKALYVEASDRDPQGTAAYLAGFCLRHKDLELAKQSEPKLLTAARRSDETGAISMLLALYVEQKRSKAALELFRQAMSDVLFLRVDSVISMFDVITAGDMPSVTQYLHRAWNNSAMLDDDFIKVVQAMEQHGWGDQADSLCESFANTPNSMGLVSRLLVVAKCYQRLKKYSPAFLRYKEIATAVESKHETDETAVQDLTDVITALKTPEMKQQAGSQSLLSQATQLVAFHQDQIRRRQCLDMAKQLNHTAFELEKNCSYAMAQKLYQQALEIKQINLAANDPETANQMLDVARNAGEQKNYVQAQSLYERALATLRKSPHTDPSDTIGALENYGQILNKMKQEAKAAKIYDEARELSRKIHTDDRAPERLAF